MRARNFIAIQTRVSSEEMTGSRIRFWQLSAESRAPPQSRFTHAPNKKKNILFKSR